MKANFFMRFYDKPKEDLSLFIEKIQNAVPELPFTFDISKLEISMNPFLKEGNSNWQVDILFANFTMRDEFIKSEIVKKMYTEYSGSTPILREPGDTAFEV
jgi:hypothetical protein